MKGKKSDCQILSAALNSEECWGRRRRDRLVIGITTTCAVLVPITTNVVSLKPACGEVYSIQHYMIKLVHDLRQVGGFLRVLRFPPPIKMTTTI